MTNLRDTNLPNALRLLKEASLRNPQVGTVTNDAVAQVMAREMHQSSLSDRVRADRSIDRIMNYIRLAAEFENVGARPTAYDVGFPFGGSIMDVMTCGAIGGVTKSALFAADAGQTFFPEISVTEPNNPDNGTGDYPQLPAHAGDNPVNPTEHKFGRIEESKF